MFTKKGLQTFRLVGTQVTENVENTDLPDKKMATYFHLFPYLWLTFPHFLTIL